MEVTSFHGTQESSAFLFPFALRRLGAFVRQVAIPVPGAGLGEAPGNWKPTRYNRRLSRKKRRPAASKAIFN
ncbi:hypothetical protein [Acidovorax sp. SDU_ACID1]|uniref:hypothetical protein n=1 Tax=Acidovorax sp. SDU_ACID1 TaxID=3136632 RepID=UPI003873B9A0